MWFFTYDAVNPPVVVMLDFMSWMMSFEIS
jgi:hypothetical protein